MQISSEARELRQSRPARRVEQPDAPQQRPDPPISQEDPRLVDSRSVPLTLAVRTGPAPMHTLSSVAKSPDEALRDGLSDRARLQDIDVVLEPSETSGEPSATGAPREPAPGAEALRAQLEPAADDASEEPEVDLMGDGSRAADRPILRGEARPEPRPDVGFEAAAQPLPVQTSRPERAPEQETTPAKRSDEPDELQRATAVASQVGAVEDPEAEASRRSAAGSSADSRPLRGEEAARRAFTQGGAVEAQAQQEIVSRFLGESPEEDPGPEPRPQQVFGQRSLPLSVYA